MPSVLHVKATERRTGRASRAATSRGSTCATGSHPAPRTETRRNDRRPIGTVTSSEKAESPPSRQHGPADASPCRTRIPRSPRDHHDDGQLHPLLRRHTQHLQIRAPAAVVHHVGGVAVAREEPHDARTFDHLIIHSEGAYVGDRHGVLQLVRCFLCVFCLVLFLFFFVGCLFCF